MRKTLLAATLAAVVGCSTPKIREEDYHITEPVLASIQYECQEIERVTILDNGRQRGKLYRAILKDPNTVNIHATILKCYIPIEVGNHELQIEITDKKGKKHTYTTSFRQN